MKINEIYPGEKRNLQATNFNEIWDKLIIPNCSEILDLYKSTGALFYRGIDNNVPIFRGYSRNDRRPRDNYIMLSELFEIGLKHLGMTALRTNSIFVINNAKFASSFGKLYIIFPINGFEYTWFRPCDITLNGFYEFLNFWSNTTLNNELTTLFKKDFPSNNHDWVYAINTSNNTLSDNMDIINEILRKEGYKPIKPIDLIDFDKFKYHFAPNNTNLIESLTTGRHETMIKGSYYAFDAKKFIDLIRKKLK